MSSSESEYEACDGLCRCDALYDSDWDMEECFGGCVKCICPCKEEVEDESCVYDCCGYQLRLVTNCDEMCCNVCTNCSAFWGAIGSMFGAIYSFIKWVFNFRIKRAFLYGKDVDPKNKGRVPCISNHVSEQTEHWIMCLFSMLMSLADTATDVFVIHKWLTYEPNEWEALALIIVCVFSWVASAWLRVNWFPDGDLAAEEESAGCWKWLCSSLPFHFVGMGVAAEGLKALGDYDGIQNSYRNVNPYKWVEVLFESGPSALLTIYVVSKDSLSADARGDTDVLAELISVGVSLFFIAWGMASTFTQEIPRDKDVRAIGENSGTRMVMALLLILCDLVFRLFLLTMWVTYGNVLTIDQTWMKFLVGFGAVWVFEGIMVSINGMVAAWWQIPVQAYTQIFQGGICFFSRSWPREDKKNRGHTRNILTFFLRYVANWGVFLWIYFELSQREGSYISKLWTDIMIIFAAFEPLLFMLKPPAITPREAFVFVKMITELGWRRGRTSYIARRTTTKIQMATNPAGGRVNYGNQSMQSMRSLSDSSDFV